MRTTIRVLPIPSVGPSHCLLLFQYSDAPVCSVCIGKQIGGLVLPTLNLLHACKGTKHTQRSRRVVMRAWNMISSVQIVINVWHDDMVNRLFMDDRMPVIPVVYQIISI